MISFDIVGTEPSRPGDAEDTYIKFEINGREVRQDIHVVVPRYFDTPYPEATGATVCCRCGLNQHTRPPWPDSPLPPDTYILSVLWHHDLRIYVNDQYDESLGDLYVDAMVEGILAGIINLVQY